MRILNSPKTIILFLLGFFLHVTEVNAQQHDANSCSCDCHKEHSEASGSHTDSAPDTDRATAKTASATASASQAPKSSAKAWSGSASFGYTTTGGNTDVESFVPALAVHYGKNGDRATFAAKGAIDYFADTTTQEQVKGIAVYRSDFSNKDQAFGQGDGAFYWGAAQLAMYDAITGIDYRTASILGVGAHVLKESPVVWDLEVGPGYLWEKDVLGENDYTVYRVASYSRFDITKEAFFNFDVDFMNSFEDSEDYIINVDGGITVAVTPILQLKVGGYGRYENIQTFAPDRFDWIFGSSLGVAF